MHATFAKALDWCVIQLARRSARVDCPASIEPALSLDAGAPPDFRVEPVTTPVDFTMLTDGRFHFSSPVQTAAPENNTVHGRLYAAAGEPIRRPTVVLLHGWNADWCYHRMFPKLAARFESRRINTATLELPYHMQRRPRAGPVRDFISSDLRSMLEATRQAVADVRALCRWLEAQGSTAVGLWGFSLGAWLAGLTTAIEPCLGCAVLTTPIASLERAIAELAFCEPVRRGLERQKVDLRGLNLWALTPRLDPARLLLVESRYDLFAPAETVEHLWRAWREPVIWRVPHGHISVLGSRLITANVVQWMAERLSISDSPAWLVGCVQSASSRQPGRAVTQEATDSKSARIQERGLENRVF